MTDCKVSAANGQPAGRGSFDRLLGLLALAHASEVGALNEELCRLRQSGSAAPDCASADGGPRASPPVVAVAPLAHEAANVSYFQAATLIGLDPALADQDYFDNVAVGRELLPRPVPRFTSNAHPTKLSSSRVGTEVHDVVQEALAPGRETLESGPRSRAGSTDSVRTGPASSKRTVFDGMSYNMSKRMRCRRCSNAGPLEGDSDLAGARDVVVREFSGDSVTI
eukprot:CAMPEP_0203924624 /NCGR_PEP_ID=MMETSP0359-20131031/64355_1 /ASSEMBLY_ACC=CAM_ASM_000338 /TAXON_ID=268821 /ORGANISM="Scrippsiella Hangoei, Strain SHTV-5" /LENGTH=223 /DNA_ID=CAMNT_0050852885 /DNA_START=97 /DNA_END=768 /DNA_ORIENTATION=+